MPSRVSLAFILLLLGSLPLAACVPGIVSSVRSSAILGDFGGDAGPALHAKLAGHSPFFQSAKGAPLLTGDASFVLNVEGDNETVVSEEKVREMLLWEEDKLTGQVYQVMAQETKEVASDYPFQRTEGTLTVDWRLSDPESGGLLGQGTLSYRGERAHGGYLANRGGNGKALDPQAVGKDLLNELAGKAAAELIEMSGPLFTLSDLAPATDPMGQEAGKLVAKGDWQGAARLWSELLTQNPGYAPALYNLGLFNEQQGDLVLAWEHYRRAFLVDQGPRYRAALTRVTDVLRHQNQLP
ncbi:MAG: HrpB1 family type III secretion system apparatus protein, partial [Deltaproteobacteria bacterium]|nr:HrpB1 family type III secretion system apparatus protein [Deltaproteobacteria bacterium]